MAVSSSTMSIEVLCSSLPIYSSSDLVFSHAIGSLSCGCVAPLLSAHSFSATASSDGAPTFTMYEVSISHLPLLAGSGATTGWLRSLCSPHLRTLRVLVPPQCATGDVAAPKPSREERALIRAKLAWAEVCPLVVLKEMVLESEEGCDGPRT